MNQSQFDSYSKDSEVVGNSTPAKTLTEPKEVSSVLFKGKDGLGEEYSLRVSPLKNHENGKRYSTVVFYGHQTRIEMLFQEEVNKELIKNRLTRLGYFFKKLS